MAYYFTMIDGDSGLGYTAGAVEDFYNDILNQVMLIEHLNPKPKTLTLEP